MVEEARKMKEFAFTAVSAVIAMLCMLEGKCPKCGTRRIGWALRNWRHQLCPECGVGLEITNGDRRVPTGHSPSNAEKHTLKPPDNVPPSYDGEKDSNLKNE